MRLPVGGNDDGFHYEIGGKGLCYFTTAVHAYSVSRCEMFSTLSSYSAKIVHQLYPYVIARRVSRSSTVAD
jgi:hypothetical protein